MRNIFNLDLVHQFPSERQERRLQSYIRRIEGVRPNNRSSDESISANVRRKVSEELLRLIFSYERSRYRLHLQRQRSISIELAYLTLDELSKKKKKDPTLNRAYDLVMGLQEDHESKTKQIILEMADRILNDTSAKNRAISKLPRVRKEHALRSLLREIIEDYPNSNHIQLRKKVLIAGKNSDLIYEIQEAYENVVFIRPDLRDVSFSTIRDWVSQIKNENNSLLTG